MDLPERAWITCTSTSDDGVPTLLASKANEMTQAAAVHVEWADACSCPIRASCQWARSFLVAAPKPTIAWMGLEPAMAPEATEATCSFRCGSTLLFFFPEFPTAMDACMASAKVPEHQVALESSMEAATPASKVPKCSITVLQCASLDMAMQISMNPM